MARLLVDEDVATSVAAILNSHGHDVVTVDDLRRKGSKDDAVLLLAARMRRILVSHNGGDFVMLHRAWHRWRVADRHAGILIPRQSLASRPEEIARAIVAFLSLNLPTDGELYTLEPDLRWQRFETAAAIADTAFL